jgi:glyoxylase-like metal-dependent hydrolase (beta-lactamase superfamily II)
MRVHHLNCATLCPRGGRLVNGSAPICCGRARLVCHCLLVETRDGLLLVDTGLGLADVLGRRGRGHTRQLRSLGSSLREEETAVRQVARLGYSPDEVRHVVLTHLDLDHAGGLSDFPKATVHVLAREREAASARRSFRERRRYAPATWSHMPRWALHHPDEGERWFGFQCVREIQGLPPEVLLVPLAGHTHGHAGVAVQTPERWLLHAGDAYFHYGEVNPDDPWCSPGLDLFQRAIAMNDGARRHNQERLRQLVREHRDAVRVFSAHDPTEFEALAR